jgi:hypothetical protein
MVEGRVLGVGVGPSRRVAETAAAQRAMETLRTESSDRRSTIAPDHADGAADPAEEAG